MSEMVERVAAVIAAGVAEGLASDAIALKVIEAMRVPTARMVTMAQTAPVDMNEGLGVPDDFCARFRGDARAAAASVWADMVHWSFFEEPPPADPKGDIPF